MSRICFPHHVKGNSGSLNEAVRYLKNSRNGWNEGILCKIVQYNPCYRDTCVSSDWIRSYRG